MNLGKKSSKKSSKSSRGKGRKRTQEEREAISRGQQARWRRAEEELGVPESGRKRCSKCGLVKTWDTTEVGRGRGGVSEFPTQSRKLVDGRLRYYPGAECKECAVKRVKEYKNRLREEGRYGDALKRWNAKRKDPLRVEKQREYNRQWSAIQRRKAGVPVRGPHKSSVERMTRLDGRPRRVDPEPLALWLELFIKNYLAPLHVIGQRKRRPSENMGLVARPTLEEWCKECGLNPREIYRLRKRQYKTVDIAYVDKIMTAAGAHDQVAVLYPPVDKAA